MTPNRILTALLLILATASTFGQTLKKYPVGSSGCSAYFFCVPDSVDHSKSPDSSDVYTTECISKDHTYGIICVKLKDAIPDINDADEVLLAYLDYLKTSLKIKSAAGYGKGHRLKNNENIHGVIDYWFDEEKNNWKIKGWTDGKYMCAMYAYSKNLLDDNRVDIFLNSLVLPGM